MTSTFVYKVRDRTGAVHEGSLEAQSEQLVIAKLREMGYVPVSVKQRGRSMLSADMSFGSTKVELRDVAIFSRQLATMVNAGLTIIRALSILTEQTESKALASVALQVKGDIERGLSLSQAISKHPKVFPSVYLSMVRSGETGGMLDEVLLRLAVTLEKQLELKRKIKSAMTYPIAIGCIIVLIVGAMLMFVVPMFEGMYNDLGGTLPMPTRILIALSGVLTTYWWMVGLGGAASLFGFRRWAATPNGRYAIDRAKLKMPVFGSLVHKSAIARFTRTLSSLIRSGVPIMEALDIVGETAGNAVVARAMVAAKNQVRVGQSLSASLGTHDVFPDMVVQMMAVGEETGALDEMLEKIAEFYDGEVSATVDALTSLIEPLLMVAMGLTVGGMVVALYLPMFRIINLVK
ncbi:MAG: type II secretion system F family protein [Acidimicrobiia bacterium]